MEDCGRLKAQRIQTVNEYSDEVVEYEVKVVEKGQCSMWGRETMHK